MLTPSRMELAEYERSIWAVTVSEPFEETLVPEYWTHVAGILRKWHRIEVMAKDGSYYAELIVIASGKGWVQVKVLTHVELADTMRQEDDEYVVNHGGRHHLWRVLRKSDKEIMSKGHETRALAEEWLDKHKQETA